MKTILRYLCATCALLLPAFACGQPPSSAAAHRDTAPELHQDIFGHPLPLQKHVLVFGQDIAYYDLRPTSAAAAAKTPLVLLHGYGSQADVDFGPALISLAKERRVIALDQIGSGYSSKPLIEYRMQTYVDFLGEFLRVLHVTKFDLLGESLGGWTAALYARQSLAPGSNLAPPRRLVLEAAAGFTTPSFLSANSPLHLSVATVDDVVTGLQGVFYDKSMITRDVARRRFITKLAANDGMVTSTLSRNPELLREIVGPSVQDITLPTLLLWGGNDTTIPPAVARAYADALPHASLVLIEHAGHVPSLEQPAEFVRDVNAFLQ